MNDALLLYPAAGQEHGEEACTEGLRVLVPQRGVHPSHLSNGCEEMAHIIAAEVIRRPGRPAGLRCE
jgi:hypothetical protein